jgi:hypothetical protein
VPASSPEPEPAEVATAPAVASAPAAPAPVELPAPFAWPEIPDLAKVATAPLHGSAAGVPFEVGSVVIKHDADGWSVHMTFANNPPQSAHFDLPMGKPAKGKKLVFKTEFGERAGLTLVKADEPGKLTGFVSPNSFAIEFTEFTAGTSRGPGRASGRLGLAFKPSPVLSGMPGYAASWIVGTFADAPVEP